MTSGSFIERHGLVRYTDRLSTRYPRTGECEVGACRVAAQHDAERVAAYRARASARLSRVLEELAALAGQRESLLAQQPTDEQARRERRQELNRVERRGIELCLARDRLTRIISKAERQESRERQQRESPEQEHANRPLLFDHCHEHGWVRGLVCLYCNRLLGVADAGGLAGDDSPWTPMVLAFRRNCPDCRTVADKGKP